MQRFETLLVLLINPRIPLSGICGIISFDPSAPVDGIDRMTGAAPWRGPDGTGVWRGKGAVLAHQALHVTPESRYEEQPLLDEEAGLVLVADARIDNRDDLQRILRRDLRRSVRRDVFTDADLILAAYRRWGTDCAAHLLGDFAFAVWDRRKRQLFAARDPMAMRPFYYRIEEDRVLFGSEVKQILAAPGVPREIFEPMVAMHLFRRFDRQEWTFYKGISQLKAAHSLIVKQNGKQHTWRYWDIDPTGRLQYSNEQDYVEHFREVFGSAVRARMRSSYPVGLFLSGGIDSMTIAATAGQLKLREDLPDFHTLSWAFRKFPQCDERSISDQVAKKYNFPTHYIDVDDAWPLKGYPDYGPDISDPFIGNYQVPIEHGVQMARERNIRVLCSGARGDIMVGEYIFDFISLFWKGEWGTLKNELIREAKYRNQSLAKTINHALIHTARKYVLPKDRYTKLRTLARAVRGGTKAREHEDTPSFVNPSLRDLLPAANQQLPQPAEFEGNYGRWQRYQVMSASFPKQIATWCEWSYARHGCRFCDPWADVRVAQFVYNVPQRMLNKTDSVKHLPRLALKGWVPEACRVNARKVSPAPLYNWSMKKKAKPLILELLTNMHADRLNYVDQGQAVRYYEQVLSGVRDLNMEFWWVLTLEMWLRNVFSSRTL